MKNALWQTVLGEIELSVSHASFITWFKNTDLIEHSEDKIVIGVPNVFAKQQFEVKLNQQVQQTLKKNGVDVDQIIYVINSGIKKRPPLADKPLSIKETLPDEQEITKIITNGNNPGGLNPRYTFDNFIVGSSNELAYTACVAVSKDPGNKYNPLFLYGGVGLGKTHLIQAVGNEIMRKQPSARVLYINTETFVKEFLESLRFKKKGFSDHYRGVDVLIVDDVQFIAGKERTQEEFFHTFNVLHQGNKQMIISSDQPPKAIPTLEDRLRSRLEWGMAIDIQTPDFETRSAILQTKASHNGKTLSSETVEYIAGNFQTNIRELEGALNQLLAYCEMRSIEPDLQTAQGLLGSVRSSRPHHLTTKQVIDKTAKHFQLDAIDICSPKRDKHIVTPRQIAMYLLRSELHLSFPKIANELGRKDHTTAIHSVEKIEKAIKLDVITRHQVAEIRDKLYV